VSLLTNVGFVGPMNLGLALVSQARGWGPGGIGQLLAGFGIGAVIGAAVMTRWRPASRTTAAMCAAAQGAAVFAVPITPHRWVALAAPVLIGLSGGPLAVIIVTATQRLTDDRFRGRVSSVNTLASLGITPLAMAGWGTLAGWAGITPAFAGGAALELLAAAVCLLWLRIPEP
jgi:hypothetical protein